MWATGAIRIVSLGMKKRTFIKISAALGAEALLQPVPWSRLSWGARAELPEKLKNWAGNIEYHTENLYAAKSVQEVQHYVAGRSKLKVLGTRHCFNTIADSKDGFLSLKPMEEMATMDSTAHTVTVDAGVTYGQLAPFLHEKGFALHSMTSLHHISVAAA